MKTTIFRILSCSLLLAVHAGCSPDASLPDRESAIPPSAVKMLPANDPQPPRLLSQEFSAPVPLPPPINSAGAEDSPFITSDGNTLYFFFTPDVSIQAGQQLTDGVSGIYVSTKQAGVWTKPQRVILQDAGKLALDGCEFVLGETMWFCSAREGYEGIHWLTATNRSGTWQDWRIADFDPAFEVGELHMDANATSLYFASRRAGGLGGLDIWTSAGAGGAWDQPVNLASVNTPDDEGWPALSPDGQELWFARNWGIWRSLRSAEGWSQPELIISPLAGEPSLDAAGNLYFVHHYLVDNKMIEADIYYAARN